MVVSTNLSDLHAEPTFLSELLTQITNGDELEILDEREKWCRVRQTDGYEGWTYKPFLTETATFEATHIMIVTAAALAEPGSGQLLTRIPIGTKLRVEENHASWSRIRACAGNVLPSGWVDSSKLRATGDLPLGAADARREIVSAARRLTGTYYLWGGCTDWGIDCSGLAQLAHRLAGYKIPRDARLQFPASRPVEPPFRAGDLLFFAGDFKDPQRITHVGISTGEADGWNIIHSSRGRNGVYVEDVQKSETMRKQFARAGSFLPPG